MLDFIIFGIVDNGVMLLGAMTGLSVEKYLPRYFQNGIGTTASCQFNFGNPPFSGTDKSDANGFGSFEYAVPSGYYALCTKNLAEYG